MLRFHRVEVHSKSNSGAVFKPGGVALRHVRLVAPPAHVSRIHFLVGTLLEVCESWESWVCAPSNYPRLYNSIQDSA